MDLVQTMADDANVEREGAGGGEGSLVRVICVHSCLFWGARSKK